MFHLITTHMLLPNLTRTGHTLPLKLSYFISSATHMLLPNSARTGHTLRWERVGGGLQEAVVPWEWLLHPTQQQQQQQQVQVQRGEGSLQEVVEGEEEEGRHQ
jgi:hypothetical protein